MPQQILMPALSPDMKEGKLLRWLKAEGDAVRAGEVIAEIETDKATLEFEAPGAGTLGRLLVPAGGDPVAVNAPIALLLAEGEAAAPADGKSGNGTTRGRIFATPIARRLARERGLDLAAIAGSGPNGRIVKNDVLGAAPQPAPAPRSAPAPLPTPPAAVRGEGVDVRRPPAAPGEGGALRIPHSSMRRVIARRLTEAKQSIPHYYLTLDVELDAALDLRQRLNARPAADYKLTVNDFVVKAVALALRKVPAANATWTDEAVLRFDSADVAVAVATESGLVTPIVRDADRKGVTAISNEMKDLAARARSGKLRPEEYQGGSVTISNLGMYGVREFAAIINPPQSCILALGAAEPRPVVRDGAVVVRTLMTCTLSADHRTVDGAVGAEFLAAFKSTLEDPLQLFL
jgi:pyruvate dehydrogenase E2 component (dihydrolipoamide acetyltransferase)